MQAITEYLNKHAVVAQEPQEGFADLGFMCVGAAPTACADEFKALMKGLRGSVSLDLFDHQEHSYIEIGSYVGSQEVALIAMGLGSALNIWQLLSPKTVIQMDNRSEIGSLMIGNGMLSVIAAKEI
jgi:hypothetical protein